MLAALAIALAAAILAVPLVVDAQPAGRPPRIGYLVTDLASQPPQYREAFVQGLRDLGRVEGQSIAIEYRSADGKTERFPALAAEMVGLKVDVLVTGGGTPAALAAKQATRTIPIVAIGVGDPVTSGLVASLARPGGNVTGLALLFPELVGKALEQLKLAVPGIAKVAVFMQPGSVPEATYKQIVEEVKVAARGLKVGLQLLEVRGPADLDQAFAQMSSARADALYVPSTPVLGAERRRIADLAARHRLPTVFSFRDYVEAGGLMSYGPELSEMFRRAATYVDRILKGASPGELPVEQPTRFELVVNARTARALGLVIPPPVLSRADHVFQ